MVSIQILYYFVYVDASEFMHRNIIMYSMKKKIFILRFAQDYI